MSVYKISPDESGAWRISERKMRTVFRFPWHFCREEYWAYVGLVLTKYEAERRVAHLMQPDEILTAESFVKRPKP